MKAVVIYSIYSLEGMKSSQVTSREKVDKENGRREFSGKTEVSEVNPFLLNDLKEREVSSFSDCTAVKMDEGLEILLKVVKISLRIFIEGKLVKTSWT